MFFKHMKNRKIALEYEFLAIDKTSGEAARRDQVKEIWKAWSLEDHVTLYTDYGTKQPVGVIYEQRDGKKVIVNSDGGVNIIEFGFLPFDTVLECEQNMKEIIAEFLSVAETQNIVLIDLAVQPKTPYYYPDLKTEKTWYRGFYRKEFWAQYHHYFSNIAAHQVCIDVPFEDAMKVFDCVNGLSGVMIALCANSTIESAQKSLVHEEREHRWNLFTTGYPEKFQRYRGIPKEPLETFQQYVERNWSLPYIMTIRDSGKYVHVIPEVDTIKDYFYGNSWSSFDIVLSDRNNIEPSIADVSDQLQYGWPMARPRFEFSNEVTLDLFKDAYENKDIDSLLKGKLTKLYIETRCIASQPWESIMSAPALVFGMIENIEKAEAFVKSKPWQYWIDLRDKTIEKSLEVDEVIPLAKALLDISKEGLQGRGLGEEKYLEPLYERLEKQESPAMKSIQEFEELGIDKFIEKHVIKI
ncbi:MAG: hypothetical protein COX81_03145 [Candidatus Magasanikbacteria bacterium CG_4_10_14_0_2_um_filter_37_12]|uniref:glutamate--cysteine ligase n=1 Tax=Candidatus Magasanikbacteria bacterium CG_4_10_14_0_2_um_filter_37_12 TaxID=1974637 RepID=A0A2M7V786_9BACT|nr:MAG: hypothetical protein COX81_03145 [Candidatus Magasanikbacteria bacterium CG_4_10_14_0_2_um_filter_37_12]